MRGLDKRKMLASKVLGVGKGKIYFDSAHLPEIKEAITKQDIRDLYQSGIIKIKPNKGRRTNKKRKTKRGPGKIKMKVRNRKRDYVKLVRKQRRHVHELRKQGKISREDYTKLRVKIRAKTFKSKAALKEHIGGLK